MDVTGFSGLMTATVFLPAVGAVAILLLVRGDRNIRLFAVAVVLADLVLALLVFALFDQGEGSERFQLVDRFTWIPAESLNASFFMAVDGLSAPLIALTGLLGICAVLASMNVTHRVKVRPTTWQPGKQPQRPCWQPTITRARNINCRRS